MATVRSQKARALQKKAQDTVMLAHTYSPKKHILEAGKKTQVDITNWIIQEKLDGVRAVWKDGTISSRYGNTFPAPNEFLHNIKQFCLDNKLTLDGELVSSKGFQYVISVVRDKTTKNTMEYWNHINYIVFDAPEINYDFCVRDLHLRNNTLSNKHVSLLDPEGNILDKNSIPSAMKKVVKKGGEGLILRNPHAYYQYGKSWDLLKVKPFEDTEVEVIGYTPGEGKYVGMVGALICKLDTSIEFECASGLTDEDRKNPPKIGDRITVRYQSVTEAGSLRHPVFVGVRDYE